MIRISFMLKYAGADLFITRDAEDASNEEWLDFLETIREELDVEISAAKERIE